MKWVNLRTMQETQSRFIVLERKAVGRGLCFADVGFDDIPDVPSTDTTISSLTMRSSSFI